MTVGVVYKGDVSEVTMGHETGLWIQSDSTQRFWIAANAAATPDFTSITFEGTGAIGDTGLFEPTSPILKVPLGMLIGIKMVFQRADTTGNNFSSHYYDGNNGRMHTIVDHILTGGKTVLKIVPALPGITSLTSGNGDGINIFSTGFPTILSGTSVVTNANADASKEVSNVDQFIGLASFLTLPDTKVELHKYHVVGLGRQVAVQQTGRLHHTGGALEMPLNSPRWLYYCLGREVLDQQSITSAWAGGPIKTGTSIEPGQTYVDLTTNTIGGEAVALGDYVMMRDTTLAPTTTYKAATLDTDKYWPATISGLTDDTQHFEYAQTTEARRVTAIQSLSSGYRVFVDDPWSFAHTTDDTITLHRYDASTANNSPHIETTNFITNPVRKLLYSADTIPSFCIEHSIRTRDVGSHSQEAGTVPGSSTDSKQLTRIFRGCKIVEWELSSTVDAELKFRAVFDSLSCYTDTGRLEAANTGDRYTSHRMFQNIATDAKGRKESGIANGSEKPFMFYNGSIEAFNQSIGYVTGFELRGKTGVELFHTIQSNPVAETVDANNRSTKQVPWGGTRNASIIREGREEFELELDVVLTDPLLWHELRSHLERNGTVGSAGNLIHLYFSKPTTGSGTFPQSFRVLMDDYVITEAPIPVPDDKGLLRSKIMLHPRNIKIVSEDTLFHC
jgi:hypothetical protein